MENELVMIEAGQKRELQPRVRKYRMELDSIKRELSRAYENYVVQHSKEQLLGSLSEGEEVKGSKAKLLNQQEKLRAQNDQLEGAKKAIIETDKVSFEIMDGLDQQNKVAAGTRGKVKEVFAYLGESNSVISRMLRREQLMKFVLAGVMIIVAVAVIYIIYKKLFG